jgi:hypothetical protein
LDIEGISAEIALSNFKKYAIIEGFDTDKWQKPTPNAQTHEKCFGTGSLVFV